ncbi:MAG TPA: hypothetical protein VFW90_02535 [Candidatus Saccharimonadales bacterium]|nr:hypothetical protein [Candidatus Saccharimonadales bacterium]
MPNQTAHRGQRVIYDMEFANFKATRVGKMTIDVKFAKQSVSKFQLLLPPGGVKLAQRLSGAGKNHMVWVVKGIPPSNGVSLTVFTRVLRHAKGNICNRFFVTVSGRRGDYSNIWGGNTCTPIK